MTKLKPLAIATAGTALASFAVLVAHAQGRVDAAALAPTQPAVAATTPVIYPAKGQSALQQDKDKYQYQCYGWARGQTGFDPMQPTPAPQTAAASPQGPARTTAGGFVRGAAVGAAVGELAHNDAGRGAAAGALGGAALEGVRQRQAAQARQQQAAQQQAMLNQQKVTFDRAFGACMEARGYAVK